MPAPFAAPSGARRSLSPFCISLRSGQQTVQFTALAYSAGEALCNALALPSLTPPVAGSVKPFRSSADALRLFRCKKALADLVE